MENPKYQPTAEAKALEKKAAEKKRELADGGHALEIEQNEGVSIGMERVMPIKEVALEAKAMFARLEEKSKAMFDAVRAKITEGPQFIPCEIHTDERRAVDFDLSSIETRKRGETTLAYGDCPACATERARYRTRAFWSKRGVPERVLEATFANYQAETTDKENARDKVKVWAKRRGLFLVLLGTPGTGKGHLAAAALKIEGEGLWVEHVRMMSELRESYTSHTTADTIARWVEAPMLVMDEFGLSPGGKDEEPMLYQVVAGRYDARRPTIITSNLDDDDFREAIGFRLLDRAREDLVKITMNWPSFRSGK